MKKNFMSKVFMLASVLTVSLCMSIGVLGATQPGMVLDKSGMKISWSDEFDGTELNRSFWTPEIGNGNWGWGNNELEYYQDSPDNINVSDGTLKITARAQKAGSFDYTSARLKTAGKVEVGYGYVEARIKLPSVDGLWPAFWMLGANEPKGWPFCGEIDILESWNLGDFAQNCFHFANAEGKDDYSNVASRWNIGKTNWHTYGVLKTETTLTFYYDGERASKVIDITDPVKSEAHNDYYILLNVACGGNLASNHKPSESNLPASMEVDYVRYYVDKTPEDIAAEEASKAAEESSKKVEESTQKAEQQSSETSTQPAKPKKAVIKTLRNVKKKKIKLTVKKIKGVSGYKVRYCDNKKFFGYSEKNMKKASITIKKLNKKQTYWVKVRAYKKYNGKTISGPWSKVKKIKIKK